MKRLPKEDRAGLYVTVIVHLAVLIILLGIQLGVSLKREQSFVLDFSQLEKIEQLKRERDFQQAINDRLNQMLAEAGGSPVMNVAVDRSALKDDRSTQQEAEQLYRDAEKLQEQLRQSALPDEDGYVEPVREEKKDKPREVKPYSGPSVLAWELEGRKASHLPIPAYRCMGAGEVKVLITVRPQGTVMMAKIDEASSSSDGCLRSFAIRAARLSRFSSSTTAPARQAGYIIYQFIAQ